MAKGPISSILVTIRSPSESRSPKSEIRIHWIIEKVTNGSDFDEILWIARVWPN